MALSCTSREARALAQIMVDIGVSAGRKMVALISDMSQPLGEAVGNALEVREAIETLRGGGPADLREHCLTVAAHMLRLGRQDTAPDAFEQARAELEGLLDSGAGFDKLRALVQAQGGDVRMVDNPALLPQARLHEVIPAPRSGWVSQVNALRVAQATLELGAGREKKEDPIDPAVGVVTHVKVGDRIEADAPAFTIHANEEGRLVRARSQLEAALEIAAEEARRWQRSMIRSTETIEFGVAMFGIVRAVTRAQTALQILNIIEGALTMGEQSGQSQDPQGEKRTFVEDIELEGRQLLRPRARPDPGRQRAPSDHQGSEWQI